MLIKTAIVLILMTLHQVVLSRHIRESGEEETPRRSITIPAVSSNTKRQLRKTHLRIHSKPPKTLQLQEGDSDFLECQAGGTPAPAIHWLKDGIIIPQVETSQGEAEKSTVHDATNSKGRLNVSFTNSRFYLNCLSVEDQGEYTCVAENPYQRISSSTTLIVSSSDDEIDCEKKSHGQAPRIVLWTKTMIGAQGDEAKFTCRADGYPRPTIRWLGVQGEELTSEDFDKYEILPEGDLIIKDLGWSDLGNYNCIAENVHGKVKVEVFLYPTIINK